MIEAILDHWMIESSADFWIFIGGFTVISGAILAVVWRMIFRFRRKK